MTRPEAFAFAAGSLLVGLCTGACWPRVAIWALGHHSRATKAYNAAHPRLVWLPVNDGAPTTRTTTRGRVA